jgi:membrane protein DedA with SNARE-associated domain
VTAESLLLLVAVIILGMIASYFYGKYRQAHRDELRLKHLRNRRARADGHHQEKIRQAEEQVRRNKG